MLERGASEQGPLFYVLTMLQQVFCMLVHGLIWMHCVLEQWFSAAYLIRKRRFPVAVDSLSVLF